MHASYCTVPVAVVLFASYDGNNFFQSPSDMRLLWSRVSGHIFSPVCAVRSCKALPQAMSWAASLHPFCAWLLASPIHQTECLECPMSEPIDAAAGWHL